MKREEILEQIAFYAREGNFHKVSALKAELKELEKPKPKKKAKEIKKEFEEAELKKEIDEEL